MYGEIHNTDLANGEKAANTAGTPESSQGHEPEGNAEERH